MCHVSCVMCHMLRVACHLSPVTSHLSLTPTATATGPSPANYSTMHSRLEVSNPNRLGVINDYMRWERQTEIATSRLNQNSGLY